MFGFGWPEFTVLLIICFTFLAIKGIKKNNLNIIASNRKCLACGFVGPMKTWLANYSLPQFIALVLLFFWILPGLIFIAWAWGKSKCPRCGAVGKNMMLDFTSNQDTSLNEEKKCPFCAENIKSAAKVCKHCQRDIPA